MVHSSACKWKLWWRPFVSHFILFTFPIFQFSTYFPFTSQIFFFFSVKTSGSNLHQHKSHLNLLFQLALVKLPPPCSMCCAIFLFFFWNNRFIKNEFWGEIWWMFEMNPQLFAPLNWYEIFEIFLLNFLWQEKVKRVADVMEGGLTIVKQRNFSFIMKFGWKFDLIGQRP